MTRDAVSDSAYELALCARCGANPSITGDPGDICRFCSQDDDFDACPYCHGTECTLECEDDL